jgi:putative nucleotidyltransferase with HDIG domain
METHDGGRSANNLAREVTEHLEELPLLPMVVTRIMMLDPDDRNYFEKVLALAEEDPTFAVRLIRMANSVAFMPSDPIVDLKSAMTRIGTRHIAAMLTSLSVMEIFVPTREDIRNLWLHSIQTAVGARLMTARYLSGLLSAEEAYLCGLLHDIGRFVLFETVTEETRHINEEDWESTEELIELEQQRLGVNHSELGWLLCRKWHMPEKVSTVVKEHHSRELEQTVAAEPRLAKLIRLIQIADRLSVLLLRDHTLDLSDTPALARQVDLQISRLCDDSPPVTTEQVVVLVPGIVENSLKMTAALGLRLG